MTELRLVVAMLVSRYHIAFAPGSDSTSVMRDLKDQFTANPGKLDLTFTALQEA